LSSGNKKWVTEQTSLTGGIVDIYVEDKTTLTGAVIASTTGDLTLDTGSLEFSNIKDKDISSNLGGGISGSSTSTISSDEKGNVAVKTDNTGSVNATYGFTDKRQTNFATIGEGTITVRDTEDTAAALEGLNRDVSISQYNTKDGGLQGGFTVDKATINLIGKTVEAVQDPLLAGATIVCDTITTVGVMLDDMSERNDKIIAGAKDLEKQTEVIVENAGTWIEDNLFTSDDEGNAENTPKVGVELTDEQKEQLQAYGDKKDFRDADQEASERNSLTGRVKEQTGWDGQPIVDKNNTVILDQNQLEQYGMPDKTGACVFLSTVDGAAKTLGVELTPEQVKQVYELAKDNKAIGVNWGTYGVDDYDKLTQAVATVTGVSNNAKVGDLTLINRNDDTSRVNTTKTIIETIDDGGAVNIRFDKDPSNSKSNAHTMSVTAASVDSSGNTILHVNDTNHPDTPTYINTNTMTLYTEDDDEVKHESLRPILNYRTITKEGEQK